MRIETAHTLLDIPYNTDAFGREPFASPDFYRLFEKSKVVGPGTGWHPFYFLALEDSELLGILPAFIKTDSFGEFIFDWAWADLYRRNNLPYYPKLVCAVPFSPVNVPKTLAANEQARTALLKAYAEFLSANKALSSAHFLFANTEEAKVLKQEGFFTRKTIQYHLELDYPSFDAYLSCLKARKRKQVKKERLHMVNKGLDFKFNEGPFSKEFMASIYNLYLTTIDKKWSQAYLNQEFFELLGKEWADNLVIATAEDSKGLAAMSLFLKTKNALYGRYWGVRDDVHIPYLHFELSYYQGIEYCIRNGLKLFEAGAQGEQKLLRGFRPVEILSCHKLSLSPIHEAIDKHVKTENAYTAEQIKELERHLPFKKGGVCPG